MKNVILAFSAMLAFATASIAQNAAPAPAPVKEMKGKGQAKPGAAANALGLSAEQETSFKALNKAHQEAVVAVGKDKATAADAKKAKIAELKAKYEADVKGVMNDEQYTKWMAKRAGRAEAKAEAKAEKKANHGKKGASKGDKAPQPEAK
jgi:metal-dependent amidase/aminoacylase/carboxypeptidase family protein